MRLNSILGKGEVKDYQEKLQKQLMRRLNKKEAHLLGRYRENVQRKNNGN